MLEFRRRGRRGVALTVLLALVVAGLVGGTLMLVSQAMQRGANEADPVASVLSLVLAVGVVVTSLVAWARRRRAAARAPSSSEEVAAAADTLAEVVLAQWRHEARLRGLEDPAPMPVRWRLASASLMDHAEVIAPEGLSFEGRSDDIAQLVARFRALPRRRLVVIGGPGVGKTTLAVQMVVELLADRRDGEPIPVMLSVIEFDPAVTSPAEWLVARLQRDYPGLNEPVAFALVQRGRVLPVLDGLDEVPADRQASILRSLNTATEGVDGFILTSRRQAYLRALGESGDVLTAAAVIAPLALTPADARRYLQAQLAPHDRLLDAARHARWTDVLARLDDGRAPDLAAVVGNPLGLWLIRTVYIVGRRDPTPLIDPDRRHRARRSVGDHLLEQLIPAVVQNAAGRSGSLSTSDEQAWCRYLTTIATELREDGSRDWLWWRLASNVFRRLPVRLTAGLLLGIAASLPYVVLGAIVARIVSEDTSVLLLMGVVLCALAGFVSFKPRGRPRQVYLKVRGRLLALVRRVIGGLLLAVASLFALVATAAVVGTPGWITGWLLLTALIVPGVVCSTVIARFFSDDEGAVRSTSPSVSCRSDAFRLWVLLSIVVLVVGGTVLVILSGLSLLGLDADQLDRLMFALLIGVIAGTIFGLAAGQAQTAFLLARALLAIRRQLPFRLMRFLDHAHRLGLLRVVGSAYQFRHAELQDHLTRTVRPGGQ